MLSFEMAERAFFQTLSKDLTKQFMPLKVLKQA